jgi:hypothetical protein
MAKGRKLLLEKTGERCKFPNHVGGTNQVFSKKNFRPFAICLLPFEMLFRLSRDCFPNGRRLVYRGGLPQEPQVRPGACLETRIRESVLIEGEY